MVELITDETKSIAQRIHDARLELFAAQAIVDVVRMSISTDDDYSRHYTLQAAYDALSSIATELEIIAGAARDVQEVGHG